MYYGPLEFGVAVAKDLPYRDYYNEHADIVAQFQGNGTFADYSGGGTNTASGEIELACNVGDYIHLDGYVDTYSWNRQYVPEPSAITADLEVTIVGPEPTVIEAKMVIDEARIDFKKKADDDKVHVRGKLELGLINGDGVDISEDVIVTVGPLSETITMVEKGKKGEKWEYKRPKHGDGNIKHMTINWKDGKFDIHMDKADLTGMTNPVTISVQIGDDFSEETILMREKKHHWDYKAGH